MFTMIIADREYHDSINPSAISNALDNSPLQKQRIASAPFKECKIVDRKQIYSLLNCKEYDMDIAIYTAKYDDIGTTSNDNTAVIERYGTGSRYFHHKKCDLLINTRQYSISVFAHFRHMLLIGSSTIYFDDFSKQLKYETHQQRDDIIMPYIHKLIAKKYKKLQMKRMLKQLTFAKSTHQVIAELQDENTQLKTIINSIMGEYVIIDDMKASMKSLLD